MINFDALPQSNPFGNPDPGLYKAVIEDAEMKHGKDATKPPYLNLRYALSNPKTGKSAGTMFDIISESDNQVILYKIGRFCRACGIPLQGQIELSDLAKIVKGKEILIDVMIDDKNPKYVKPAVDLFSHEAYYQVSELEEIASVFFAEDTVENDNTGFVAPETTEEAVAFEGTPTSSASY